jgi:hypothetical protein
MKKCRSCQKEIDNKAKKCPYCQEKQGNWLQRHPILTGIIGIIVLFFVIGSASGGNTGTTNQSETSTPTPEVLETDNNSQEIPTTSDNENEAEDTSGETLAQKNAVRKAESYLDYTGFSRDGLVQQLEFEKFSNEDAVYGADNVGADWNEQAIKKAKSYLDYTAFSREGLIAQLEFDGFTTAQATHGVNAVGL